MKKYSLLLTALIFFQCASIAQQSALPSVRQGQSLLDSLLLELPKAAEDTNKVMLLNDLSYNYPYINPDEGLKYGKEGLALAEKLSWTKGIAGAYTSIGANYANKSDYANALDYEYKALKIYEQLNDRRQQAVLLRNIGIVQHTSKNQQQALEYDAKSLAIYEELHDKEGIAALYSNMANVYYTLQQMDSVLENDLKSLHLYQELNDMQGTARLLGNIANFYADEDDFQKAMSYYFNALRKENALGNKNGVTRNMGNIGETYLDIYKDTTGKIKPDSLIPSGKAANLQKALQYLKATITNAKESEQTEYFLAFSETLSEAYMLSGNNKEALKTYKDYIAVRDSVYDVEKYNEQTRRELDYVYGKREDSLAFQKQLTDVKLAEEQKSHSREQVFYVGGIVLVLVVAFVIYRSYIRQRSLNKQLADSNHILKETQHQLVQSEKMAAFGVMASRVAHEIQNPLNFVNNFSELSEEAIEEVINSDNEAEKKQTFDVLRSNLKKINHHGKRAASIIKKLQEHSNKGTAHEFFEEDKEHD